VNASGKFVRLIIRRPHAYRFAQEHKGATIPGIAFLDGEGKLTGNAVLKDAPGLLEEMKRQSE